VLDLNILQVIPVFNPPEFYGGSQQVVYQISKELAKRGHEVCVFTSDAKRSNLRERVKENVESFDGIKVCHFKNISNLLIKRTGIVVTPGFRRGLEREGKHFDVVHLHQPRGFQNLAVWGFASETKIPYVVHGHGILDYGGMPRRLYDLFYGKRVLRSASMCIALNDEEAEVFRRFGVAKDKVMIISNGIDLSQYLGLPSKGVFKKNFGIDDDEKMLLYLGRIERTKGIDFLIRCFANLVRREDRGLKLVIAGHDDGFLGQVKSLVDSLGISDLVIFSGVLTEKEKISAYIDSTVCAYLGQFEPFGLVPLEAAACGTPVIVSKQTYMAKIVEEGKFGLSVKYGNIDETVCALRSLLDDDVSKDMSLRAIESVKQFDLQKTVDQVESLYSDLVYGK
jgi:glycosyltransferase involved in cell wall biosynthesis